MQVRILGEHDATPEMARRLGLVYPSLSPKFDGSPLEVLHILGVARHSMNAWFIAEAEMDDKFPNLRPGQQRLSVIGTGILTTVNGAWTENSHHYLMDFVAADGHSSGDVRIGQAIWDAMVEWRAGTGLPELRFTSNPSRERAHEFYLRNGCEITGYSVDPNDHEQILTAQFTHRLEL